MARLLRKFGVFECDDKGHLLNVCKHACEILGVVNQAPCINLKVDSLLELSSAQTFQDHLKLVSEAAENGAIGKAIDCRTLKNDSLNELLTWKVENETSTQDTHFLCHIHRLNDDLTEDRPEQHGDLAAVVDQLQQDFISNRGAYFVFGRALEALLTFTDSEYGFIGERLITSDNVPYLQTHAISNISWNDETRQFFKQNAPSGLVFSNLKTLFGHTIITGETLITNSPRAHPKSGGTPNGHPALNCYAGVPLMCGDDFIGMAGIANRPQGYSEQDLTSIKYLLNTIGFLIRAFRDQRQHKLLASQLQLKSAQLKKANRSKSRFLKSMSHELRTPLNSIIGFSRRTYASYGKRPEQDKKSLESVVRNGNHLISIVNRILDLASLESEDFSLRMQPTAILDLISDCNERTRNNYSHLSPEISIDCNPQLVAAVDPQKVVQIILNLFSNALEAGASQIVVRAQRDDDVFIIDVSDNGPGISALDQETLFQPYTKMHSTLGERTGMGLAISLGYAEKHGGNLSLLETTEGGSTFRLMLPVDPPDRQVN